MDPEARLPLDDSSSEDGWILVNEGDLKGATLMVDRNSGEVLSISTRSCRDEDRWETVPDLSRFKCLEFLDFYKSRYITEFDATVCPAPTTRKVFLTRCDNLQTISPSIEVLQNLTELNLYDSPKIGALPEEIGKLKSLKKLSFGGSNGIGNKVLESLPESIGQLENLEQLVLDQCKVLTALPKSIGKLKKLTHLRLRGCKLLTELPESIGECTALLEVSCAKCFSLKELPDTIRNLTQLEDLCLIKCKELKVLPDAIGNCKKLCYLNLRSCVKLEKLPDCLGELPRLRFLDLAMCDNLKMVPTWIVSDSWQMEPVDLTERVKTFKSRGED